MTLRYRSTGLLFDLDRGPTVAEACESATAACLRYRSVSLYRRAVGLCLLAGADRQRLINVLTIANLERFDSRIVSLLERLAD